MSQQIEAIIFDFDGTLVNSVEIYLDLFMKLGDRFGRGVTKDDFLSLNGMSIKAAVRILVKEKKFKRRFIPYLLLNHKKLQKQVGIETSIYKEVVAMLTHLSPHYKLAIATSNKKDYVRALCQRYGLDKFIKVLVTEEDVKDKKPHPEPFFKAAKMLATAPQNCLIIEDSPIGIIAAKAAGMKTCVVEHTTPQKYFKEQPQFFIKDLSALTKEFIDKNYSNL